MRIISAKYTYLYLLLTSTYFSFSIIFIHFYIASKFNYFEIDTNHFIWAYFFNELRHFKELTALHLSLFLVLITFSDIFLSEGNRNPLIFIFNVLIQVFVWQGLQASAIGKNQNSFNSLTANLVIFLRSFIS